MVPVNTIVARERAPMHVGIIIDCLRRRARAMAVAS